MCIYMSAAAKQAAAGGRLEGNRGRSLPAPQPGQDSF